MEYVKFGRTGLKVSPLCLGCLNFSPVTAEVESIATIDLR
jgi:aryl-alcohol dehydrogenase-like predicted oxidoreductase